MWLPLAMLIVCFTIIVLFRMYIDLRRVDNQHQRMMRSDQRDYERFMDVKSRELPKAEMPNFDYQYHLEKEMRRRQAEQAMLPPARYIQPNELPSVLTVAQLEALKATYAREDYDRFIYEQKKAAYNQRRRTL